MHWPVGGYWLVEAHPDLTDRLIAFGRPPPGKADFVLYRGAMKQWTPASGFGGLYYEQACRKTPKFEKIFLDKMPLLRVCFFYLRM